MAFNIFATATSDIPLANLDANFTMIGSSAVASTLYPTATTSITYGTAGTIHYFSGSGLAVTGTLSTTSFGVLGARTQIKGTNADISGATGSGTEIFGGSTPGILAYNRDGSAYLPLTINALTVALQASSTTIGLFSSTGAAITGTFSSTLGATIYGLTVGRGGGAVSTNTVLGNAAFASNATGGFSVAIGTQALQVSTAGYNTAIGYQSQLLTNTGQSNVSVGYYSLVANLSGGSNTAIGTFALGGNTTASNNTAIGYQASYANTTGTEITSLGWQALKSNTTGNYNTAVGGSALGLNISGSNNTAIGRTSLANSTASDNTAVGFYSLALTTSGASNTAVGVSALQSNITASYNTAVGYQAGYLNTASNNVFLGYTAGYNNTATSVTYIGMSAGYYQKTGANNVAIGLNAFLGSATPANNTGIYNIAVGNSVLAANTSGSGNVGVGQSVLYQNTSGGSNVAIGQEALQANTTASNNTAVGYQAGYTGTAFASGSITALGYKAGRLATAGRITAIGDGALSGAATGYGNTAVGYQAGSLTTGLSNTYVGDYAGVYVSSGEYNVCIGYLAGYQNNSPALTTGSGNVIIGASPTGIGTATAADTNSVVIGYNISGKGSNTAYIGGSSGAYNQANSLNWSVTSDQRIKKNIVDNNVGLEKITAIRVRNFEYRLPEEVDAELKPTDAIQKEGIQLGVIAQELQAVLPNCVKTESTGVMSVNSDSLMWHMINAIKELSAKVTALENK